MILKIRVDDLQKIQNELDSRIFELHGTTRTKTRNDRILALLVEAGELANETRCFKYWSLKKASDDAVVFEEFSDVLHFSLSLGIDINFSEPFIDYEASDVSLNDQFHELYHAILTFSKSNNADDYIVLLKTIFTLAHSIGMDETSIRDMYFMKNEKNHERQDNQY